MGDIYSDMKERSQAKRANNRKQSADYLTKHDIVFTTNNNGAHLIVEGKEGYIDFWPGTGRWTIRDGESGFGVKNLVSEII